MKIPSFHITSFSYNEFQDNGEDLTGVCPRFCIYCRYLWLSLHSKSDKIQSALEEVKRHIFTDRVEPVTFLSAQAPAHIFDKEFSTVFSMKDVCCKSNRSGR